MGKRARAADSQEGGENPDKKARGAVDASPAAEEPQRCAEAEKVLADFKLGLVDREHWDNFQTADSTFEFELGLNVEHIGVKEIHALQKLFRIHPYRLTQGLHP